jgi:hypothetical protein
VAGHGLQLIGSRRRPTSVKDAVVTNALVKYAVVTVVLLTGCSGGPTGGPAANTPASAPTTDTSTGPTTEVTIEEGIGRPTRVGVLVGSRLSEVRAVLAEQGLAVEVRHRAHCAPGVVLEQRPAPGAKLERGATVHLVVAQQPAAATCIVPPGAAAVLALRAWALGDRPAPQFADHVRLLVADRPVRTLTAVQAIDPAEWNLPIAYAERSDVRILETLADSAMRGTRVPPYFCLGRGPILPADLLRRLPWSWTLVTREGRSRVLSCMDIAAVQVWADGRGRITDVNILMGSP